MKGKKMNNNNFKCGVNINLDMNNRKHGPHVDLITDLRRDIGGVDKVRISPEGKILESEVQIGKIKLPY